MPLPRASAASRALYVLACLSVVYAIVGPFVFARHLHHGTFNATYDNTPMFLFGLIGFPLAAIPIVLGSRVRSVAGGHRPGAAPHYRRSARVLGLFSLGILAAVVLFYVALKMLGLPDHPF
jgi:hypothetical protein